MSNDEKPDFIIYCVDTVACKLIFKRIIYIYKILQCITDTIILTNK